MADINHAWDWQRLTNNWLRWSRIDTWRWGGDRNRRAVYIIPKTCDIPIPPSLHRSIPVNARLFREFEPIRLVLWITVVGEYGTGGFRTRAVCIWNNNNNNNCKTKRRKLNYFIISRVPHDVFAWEPCGKTNSITRIVPWQFHYEGLKWNELWLMK